MKIRAEMLKRRDLLRQALFVAGAAASGSLASPASRAAQRFTRNPFSLGVASGYPTSDGVVLWTRLAPEPLAPGGRAVPGTGIGGIYPMILAMTSLSAA